LAGSGNTAHLLDDFAPKLVECCPIHVYGIRATGSDFKPERGFRVIQALWFGVAARD